MPVLKERPSSVALLAKMNLKHVIFIIAASLLVSHASFTDSFSSLSLEKKIYSQAQKTFEKFKENFTKKLLMAEITSEEAKEALIQGLKDTGSEAKIKSFLQKGGTEIIEDPQIQLGKLAFLYTALNRADFAAATSIKKICTAENLLDSKTNSNVCNTYSQYLIKLIEMRIGVITSRILFSSGLLGIPKGWIEHVQNMVKDLEVSGFLSESVKHLMFLLRGVAQNNEEIDTSMLPNLLSPKTHLISEANPNIFPQMQQQAPPVASIQQQQPVMIAPPPQKITIDARNLSNRNSPTDQILDSIMGQMMQKMII